MGNEITRSDNDRNIIVEATYDLAGRMTGLRDPNGHLTQYEYDEMNRRTKLTNPLSVMWETAYADLPDGGTQVQQTFPGLSAGGAYTVTREMDALGRLQQINYGDPASTPTVDLTYDLVGNRTRMTETGGAGKVRETSYQYDASRRLSQVDFNTDGDGPVEQTVSYQYDAGGLRTKLTMNDGSGDLTVDYQYDEHGRLVSMTDWDSQLTEFDYDDAGRHINTRRPNGLDSAYRYDRAGRLRSLRHLAGASLRGEFLYEVDGRGNRTRATETLTDSASGTTIGKDAAEVSYPFGTWADSGDFKQNEDGDGEISLTFTGTEADIIIGEGPNHSQFDIYVNSSLWQSFDGYAAVEGERTIHLELTRFDTHMLEIRNRRWHSYDARQDAAYSSAVYKLRFKQVDVGSAQQRVIDYTYDAISRLVQASHDSGSQVFAYSYDLAGNLTDLNGVTRTYNAANQMTNDGTNGLTYDANGNLVSHGATAYTWDRANRMLSQGGLSYRYDGNGNRVSLDDGTNVTQYLLDTQPGLAVVLGENNGLSDLKYLHGPRGVQAMDDGTNWTTYMPDGLGSVRGMVDAMAAVQQTVSYSEHGVPDTTIQGPAFTGEWRDAMGMQYHRARYYDPALAIFPSLDPFEGMMGRPMSLNGYSWVEGNPVMNTDPTGMILENPYAWDTCQGTPVAQSNTVVHIPCGQRARVRSHPSTLGRHLGTALAGQQFTALRERADSPTNQDLAPSSWVEIEFGGTTGWIRRSDGFNINVANGPAPTGCDSISPLDTPDRPVFSYGTPENTRGGTNVAECFNGTQPATRETPEGSVPACSRERVVAFVIACESGAEQYPDGSAEQKQVMADIAYVIRNRMRAGSFPDSAFDVVRQSRQFQCFTEGSGANLDIAMGQIQRTAEALVYSGDNAVLPPASIPDLDLALFFFGVGLSPDTRSNAAPNSIERENMTLFLTSNNFVGVDQSTLLGQSGNGIYLGHGPFSAAAFGTVFFSDDPRFTGNF